MGGRGGADHRQSLPAQADLRRLRRALRAHRARRRTSAGRCWRSPRCRSAGALLLLRRHAAACAGRACSPALVALGAITVAAQRWLLVTNVELIHFPQFGLLAALLLFAGLGPRAAWIGATLGGVLDETYQYLVDLRPPADVYFDYNDVVLNAIGAAWAVILGRARGPTPQPPTAGLRRGSRSP